MNKAKRIIGIGVSIGTVLVLAACMPTNVSQLATSTGKPEVTMKASRAAIGEYLTSQMLNLDYMIKNQTENVLTFFHSTTVTEEVNLFVSREVPAENRVTFNIVPSAAGTRVMVSMVTIKNPNTSFESIDSDWSISRQAEIYQDILEQMKYNFEAKNPGFSGLDTSVAPDALVVENVSGPAASAGFQVKDEIIAVDGNSMMTDYIKKQALLRQDAGTTHQFLVRRKKQQVTLSLTYDKAVTAASAQPQAPVAQSGPTMEDTIFVESIGASTKGYEVVKIVPDGPSDKAGLKVGDALKAIDGDPVPNSAMDIANKLIGKTNTAVVLTVKRGQEEVTISIIRKNPNK